MRVVELFAGVGGFRIGLERASDLFETVWANQWEPSRKSQDAFACYASHFSEFGGVNEYSNISITDAQEFCPNHDLLVGGFPCQNYSVAASLKSAKGIEGEKGVLWWNIRYIADKKRPKYLLLENVDRLLKSPAKQRGRDFGIILQTLNELGYAVEWRVINAAEYGQVQKRRRTFIFAYHKSTAFYGKIINTTYKDIIFKDGMMAQSFPCKESEKKRNAKFDLTKYETLGQLSNEFKCLFQNSGIMIDGKGYSLEVFQNYKGKEKKLGSIIQKNVDEKYYLSDEQIKKFKYLRDSKKIERTREDGSKYFYSEGSMSEVDSLDLPGRTMLTSEGSVNRSTHIIIDPQTNRKRFLTQVECERLNGFPDNWTDTGMSERFRYFTMGNALVVPLITMMGKVIEKIEENQND